METSGQRAILFADVCESTAIYESIGDARALALINRLFRQLAKLVNAAGGIIVKNLGDGIICQFRDTDGAFRAACAMQESAAKVAEDVQPPMKIKIGYNFGPVVLKDRDVFGDTVNVCARLVSLANPAQVLTTQQTVEALSPGLRGRCRELYATKVRGRNTQVSVWEVLWRADPDVTKVEQSAPHEAGIEWLLKLSIGGEGYVVQPGATFRIGPESPNEAAGAPRSASAAIARTTSW